MAIVKLSKFRLYGMNEDKDLVVNLIYKSNIVHINEIKKSKNLKKVFNEEELNDCKLKLQKTQKVIEFYENSAKNLANNEILVKEQEFINFEENNKNLIEEVSKINEILQVIEEKNNLINEIKNDKTQSESQNNLEELSEKTLVIINGNIKEEKIEQLKNDLNSLNLTNFEINNNLIEIISTEDEVDKIIEILKNNDVINENVNKKYISTEAFESYVKMMKCYKEKTSNSILETTKKDINLFKTYYDYLNCKIQKIELDRDLGFTQKTFVLEGYVEKDKVKVLEDLINSKKLEVTYTFSDPEPTDKVPTKTKNKKFVKPFEFVTNMYSVPKYGEIDPNCLVGIFFSLFFGFIMADIGYGILLVAIGLFFVLKKNTGQGLKDLMKVVAIGGIFAIGFGILFGSCLGYTHNDLAIIPKAVLPDPSTNVMMYLIASVVIGAIQIMVSFLLKGILLIRRKKIAEAICSAFAWDIFFIGAGIFLLDFAKITSGLMFVGLGIAIFGVAVSVIGNIIINKGFNRLSKSFGSLYSILNLFSDLLSYTRLFGLMLSGVIIATIVNQLAGGFYTTLWKVPFGIIISLIGHAFNISMGALGAYIHDARLQYIEFFSRFYEGEGVLFTPQSLKFSYIKLIELEDK